MLPWSVEGPGTVRELKLQGHEGRVVAFASSGISMPKELRVITFNEAEVIEALVDFSVAAGRALPQGQIAGISPLEGDRSRIALRFRSPQAGNGAQAHFYDRELAAALIMLCEKKRIPVPRRGEKAVRMAENSAALTIRLRS